MSRPTLGDIEAGQKMLAKTSPPKMGLEYQQVIWLESRILRYQSALFVDTEKTDLVHWRGWDVDGDYVVLVKSQYKHIPDPYGE